MIYDSVENLDSYCDPEDNIYMAVQFVLDFDLDQPDGKYEFEGGQMHAIFQTIDTADAKEKDFECHEKYLDVQMVLEGAERHDVVLMDREDLIETQEYDEETDLAFFDTRCDVSSLVLKPGMFVVYGPTDGHKPGISIGQSEKVRKVVVKIQI